MWKTCIFDWHMSRFFSPVSSTPNGAVNNRGWSKCACAEGVGGCASWWSGPPWHIYTRVWLQGGVGVPPSNSTVNCPFSITCWDIFSEEEEGGRGLRRERGEEEEVCSTACHLLWLLTTLILPTPPTPTATELHSSLCTSTSPAFFLQTSGGFVSFIPQRMEILARAHAPVCLLWTSELEPLCNYIFHIIGDYKCFTRASLI